MSSSLELDLVREWRNKQEPPFPDNVQLNFIFWEHTTENVPDVIPYLLGSTAVAIEQAGSSSESKEVTGTIAEKIETTFAILNLITQKDPDQNCKKHLENLRAKGRFQGIVPTLALAIEGSGVELVPVDSYVVASHHGDEWGRIKQSKTIQEATFRLANFTRFREAVALRQIHELAMELSEEHDRANISILYGASHRELWIAASRLGAHTTRNFVGHQPPAILTPAIAEVGYRMIRWGLLTREDIMTHELNPFQVALRLNTARGLKSLDTKEAAFLLKSTATALGNPEARDEFMASYKEVLKAAQQPNKDVDE